MATKHTVPPGTLEAWCTWDNKTRTSTYYSQPPADRKASRCAVLPVGQYLYKVNLMNINNSWEGPPLLVPTAYTVGFAFSTDLKEIVLIRKLRPSWQAGQLNGVGGQVEGESIRHCVAREFTEEAGVFVPTSRWHLFRKNIFPEKRTQVYFFAVVLTDEELAQIRTCTDEEVVILRVADLALTPYLVYNLSFLIPEALAWINYPEHRYVV